MDDDAAPPWSQIPADWPRHDAATLDRAARRVLAAVSASGPRSAIKRLSDYYDDDSVHSSDLVEDIFPRDPDDVSAADLLAASLIGGWVTPRQIRRLLGSTPERGAMLRSWRALPLTDLYLATPRDLLLMEQLFIDVCIALGGGLTTAYARTASAICARLRPNLFPLVGPDLHRSLGLPEGTDYRNCWLVMRHVLQQSDIRVAVVDIERELLASRHTGISRSDVRLLEAALYTYA